MTYAPPGWHDSVWSRLRSELYPMRWGRKRFAVFWLLCAWLLSVTPN